MMCCYNNEFANRYILRNVFGKRKTAVMWKVLLRTGKSLVVGYQYGPGRHRAPVETDDLEVISGCHVYISEREARRCSAHRLLRLVPVIVHRDHLVRANEDQAVFTEILILKKDWEAAFSKKRKRKAK